MLRVIEMFLKLTTTENKEFYVNENEIRKFYKDNEKYTTVVLNYGVDIVKETPEEILSMLRGY
jgi:hypothetical protein